MYDEAKVHAETGERSWMLKLETRNVNDGKNWINNVGEGLARQTRAEDGSTSLVSLYLKSSR